MARILIIMGSKSDSEIAEKAEKVMKAFGVEYQLEVASAHRNPDKVEEIVGNTSAEVIIAIAGLSAALPGVCASRTVKPVIGVPVNSKLDGLDALLSITQMPPGIPVGSVGIDNAKNAALLALQIIGIKDDEIRGKLEQYREEMKK